MNVYVLFDFCNTNEKNLSSQAPPFPALVLPRDPQVWCQRFPSGRGRSSVWEPPGPGEEAGGGGRSPASAGQSLADFSAKEVCAPPNATQLL